MLLCSVQQQMTEVLWPEQCRFCSGSVVSIWVARAHRQYVKVGVDKPASAHSLSSAAAAAAAAAAAVVS
jgi:hypothetical protein